MAPTSQETEKARRILHGAVAYLTHRVQDLAKRPGQMELNTHLSALMLELNHVQTTLAGMPPAPDKN